MMLSGSVNRPLVPDGLSTDGFKQKTPTIQAGVHKSVACSRTVRLLGRGVALLGVVAVVMPADMMTSACHEGEYTQRCAKNGTDVPRQSFFHSREPECPVGLSNLKPSNSEVNPFSQTGING